MTKVTELTTKDLEKTIDEAQTELRRRNSMLQATQEIVKILKKYNLTAGDIEFKTLQSESESNPRLKVTGTPSKQKQTRAKLPPKFKSPDGSQKWTGRGRAPGWVVALCEAENLTVDAFKKSPRFKI